MQKVTPTASLDARDVESYKIIVRKIYPHVAAMSALISTCRHTAFLNESVLLRRPDNQTVIAYGTPFLCNVESSTAPSAAHVQLFLTICSTHSGLLQCISCNPEASSVTALQLRPIVSQNWVLPYTHRLDLPRIFNPFDERFNVQAIRFKKSDTSVSLVNITSGNYAVVLAT